MSQRQLIILAGGLGKRLRARLGDLPKPMVPIGGPPLLEHQVKLAARYGFQQITVFSCYRAETIEGYFGDGSRFGTTISYVNEQEPLGTAGAVLAGLQPLAENFVVTYGDTMVNVDLERLWRKHLQSQAEATLLVHPNDHPLDSDLVETDGQSWITAFHNRPHPAEHWFQNLVNAGLYVIRKSALLPWRDWQSPLGAPASPPASSADAVGPDAIESAPKLLDFGKDLFPAMLKQGARLLAYNSPEYIKDIGTPERYDRVCAEYEAGLVQRSALTTPQPAVFLDRDGTLNQEIGGVTTPERLQLLPNVGPALRELNHHGFRTVVVTNQPVVAKGFCTEAQIEVIHRKLQTLLGREHAFLDRIYYCPHHPEKGFAGERPDLKGDCLCRKPQTGMIMQATKDLNLDLSASWLVGDTTVDLETARRAGLRAILLRTGCGGNDGKFAGQADFEANDLLGAAQIILAKRGA